MKYCKECGEPMVYVGIEILDEGWPEERLADVWTCPACQADISGGPEDMGYEAKELDVK